MLFQRIYSYQIRLAVFPFLLKSRLFNLQLDLYGLVVFKFRMMAFIIVIAHPFF